jgi:type IV pilus assembly protein PilC
MALYTYKAVNTSGHTVTGRLDAINLIDLEMRLKRMELDFINGDAVKEGMLSSRASVPRRELINFCFHLEQLTRAGVPIIEGLSDLRDSLENPRFREVLSSMIESIEGGKTLSQAMEEHSKVFDEVFTSLIHAGEDTGNLSDVLKSLNDALRWQDELAAQAKKLVMYPAFMGTVVVGVVFFMMIYLVPKMVGFITNMGQAIPMQTKILIATSNVFVHYWYVILLVPIIIAGAVFFSIQTNPKARHAFDGFKLKVPMLGDILRKIILSRFASVFAMMYGSGISIIDSIKTTERIVGNSVIREGLVEVGQMIEDGQNVTLAFQNVGLFPAPRHPHAACRREHRCPRHGADERQLFLQSRCQGIDRAVQTMIEPAMTLILGALLGWVMLAVLGPIYDTITKLKF